MVVGSCLPGALLATFALLCFALHEPKQTNFLGQREISIVPVSVIIGFFLKCQITFTGLDQ